MKRLTQAIALMFPLMGCQEPINADARQSGASQASSLRDRSQFAFSNLAGEWRVAEIDGQSVDESALSFTGNEGELWWQPRCAGMVRTYRIDGQHIKFGSAEPPRPAGAPTPPVCSIGLPHRIYHVFRALDGADFLGRTPDRVLISGANHSVMLVPQ